MTIWPDEAEVTMWAACEVKYYCVFDCEADNQPSELEQNVIKLLNDLLFSAQIASCKEDRYENQMYLFHNYLYDRPVRWLSKEWAWQHNQCVCSTGLSMARRRVFRQNAPQVQWLYQSWLQIPMEAAHNQTSVPSRSHSSFQFRKSMLSYQSSQASSYRILTLLRHSDLLNRPLWVVTGMGTLPPALQSPVNSSETSLGTLKHANVTGLNDISVVSLCQPGSLSFGEWS